MAYITETQVRQLFSQHGVPIASGSESEADRIRRIADEINSGRRSLSDVTASIQRLGSMNPDRIASMFDQYGVTIATDNETEQQRLARIFDEVGSGRRSWDDLVNSVQRLGQMQPDPPGPGEGQQPVSPAPTIDFAAEASSMFPWLSGQLLNTYADFWSDTGSPTAALTKLRNTSQYNQVFQGIRRADGTLRMDENSYWSTKEGFREALGEFGRDPRQFEKQFVKLFENEVGADEFFRSIADAHQRFVEPGATTDNGLFDTFIGRFIDSGSSVSALQDIRQSNEYDAVFQGNRRDDGTLRMDEQEWFAYKRGWQTTLAGFGLDPREFEARGRLGESVEGEISIQELNQRLQVTQDGVLDNIGAIQQFYGNAYGIDVTAEAILGMAIDPDIERDVLERRIQASQIGGEAALAGFVRDVERAETLARAGLGQEQARKLYSGAAQRLGGLSATTQRFNRGVTTLGDYEDVTVLQDAAGTQRLERSLAQEQSSFGSRSDMRANREGLGLSGLRQR